MKIINLGDSDSIIGKYISEIRDKAVQKDSMRFRNNLVRVGELCAYEISKTLEYKQIEVETPLGIASCRIPAGQVVLATIMRAGLPMHQGMLNVFDNAESAFLAEYRKYSKDQKFNIQLEYSSIPPIDGKTLILADTMIATGSSIELAYRTLCECGEPLHTHIVGTIASEDGVSYLSKNLPHKSVTLWVGHIDEELTNKSYIIPGLGDAGDLAFGAKG